MRVADEPMAAGTMGTDTSQDGLKRAAAEAAVALVEDGMAIGLGTGSTATFAIDALIRRVRQGLSITAIPTSERSARQAREGGIELVDFERQIRLDLTIDGADQVAVDRLDLIKGMGGALLREKIVAAASDRLVIVVDESKIAHQLSLPVPVEIVEFGRHATARAIAALGGNAVLRQSNDAPYRTDGGNLIVDCDFGQITDPAILNGQLREIVGVVETGLFVGMAERVLVADADGVRQLTRD
jgi:ribose 5-phosphate isomerase A